MPAFSESSKSKLATCHQELQILFNEVVKYWDCTILEGYRNETDQNAAFAKGNSKLKYPHGKHNKIPSIAVDVAPSPTPAWSKASDFYFFGGFVLGVALMLRLQGKMKMAVRYGADWNKNQRITDEKFVDAVHFELY